MKLLHENKEKIHRNTYEIGTTRNLDEIPKARKQKQI